MYKKYVLKTFYWDPEQEYDSGSVLAVGQWGDEVSASSDPLPNLLSRPLKMDPFPQAPPKWNGPSQPSLSDASVQSFGDFADFTSAFPSLKIEPKHAVSADVVKDNKSLETTVPADEKETLAKKETLVDLSKAALDYKKDTLSSSPILSNFINTKKQENAQSDALRKYLQFKDSSSRRFGSTHGL